MDETTLVQLETVKQLLMLIESSKYSRMMPLEIVAHRPDNICDVLVYHRNIRLMDNDFTDVSIFQHQSIVSAIYRTFPEPHFFVTGYLQAIHNSLEVFYLAQVHKRLGEVLTRHAGLASRSPGPYPAYYDDVRNRHFVPIGPVPPVTAVSRPRVAAPDVVFTPIYRPPVTIPSTQSRNIESLQRTLDEVNKILVIQQRRRGHRTVRPIPIRAPAPSTVVPTPPLNTPPSRLQQHFTSTPEPAAYSVQNPFCTECNSFHSPLIRPGYH
jgi:hypothetical protein